jgi:hypothetical protein
LLLLPLVHAAVRRIRVVADRPWLAGLVAAAAVLAFSALHILGMVALREALYAAAGSHYEFNMGSQLVYEFRKDVLSFVLLATPLWLA